MTPKAIERFKAKVRTRTDAEIKAYEKDLKQFKEDYRKAYTRKITKELPRLQQLSLTRFPIPNLNLGGV